MNNGNQKKTILIIGGHDPSGGAGIQADIESVTHAGCQPVSIITSLTAQNTKTITEIIPQNPQTFRRQIRLLMEDIKIDSCKIGMLGDPKLVEVVYDELSNKNIPIVLDPIIQSGSGTLFADEDICQRIVDLLIPITTIITPNSIEARALAGEDDLENAAKKLISYGACAVLITGTHEQHTENVINTLYINDGSSHEYQWPRLPETYHGSGCTLSSRIAAHIADGDNLIHAIEKAQHYTWHTLKYGVKLGQDQLHPNRFFDK